MIRTKSLLLLFLFLISGTLSIAQGQIESSSDVEMLARQLRATQLELELMRRQVNELQNNQRAANVQLNPDSSYQARTASNIPTATSNSFEPTANSPLVNWQQSTAPVVEPTPAMDVVSDSAWRKGKFRLTPFGAIVGETIASESSPQLRGSPLFLLPGAAPGVEDDRFTVSGQQSLLGLDIQGPAVGAFQTGGKIVVNFFGEQPVQNNPGLFFLLAYAELKNDQWRFWVGQDADAIGRQNTNSPVWSSHKMQGNFGQLRPGVRMERYFYPSETVFSSLYLGLTQQAVNDFIAVPGVAGTDNGIPNFETRWEVGIGPEIDGQRPILFAIGALLGETRTVDDFALAGTLTSTSWAIIPELKIEGERFGFQGELFTGQAIGTYNGAIGQSLNPETGNAISSVGGYGELFWKLNPRFTASIGYGIDDPRDNDVGLIDDRFGQRSRNEAYWVNCIWQLNEAWETRFEISHLETTYVAPTNDSASMIYHGLLRYRF